MQKILKRLVLILFFAAGINTFSVTQALAYCDPVNISSGKNAVAISGINDVDLSSMLVFSDSYSLTSSSNFSGFKLVCVTGGETLYYRNGIEEGYTVKFSQGDLSTYIKFTATMPVTSKAFTSLLSQDYPASDFDTEITLMAEVVEGPNYDITARQDGSVNIPLLYLLTSNGNNSYPTAKALRDWIITKDAASVASYTDLKGFAAVSVYFSPVNTTCVIENQHFSLPSTTLYTIKSGEGSDTEFTVPVSCTGSVNNLVVNTFNLRAYSNDLVDDTRYIIRNSSSTSSGIGFQLFSETADPLKFSAGYDPASTSLASMTRGKDMTGSLTSFNIGARYKIFDAATASPGTVVGTIIIYMEYE